MRLLRLGALILAVAIGMIATAVNADGPPPRAAGYRTPDLPPIIYDWSGIYAGGLAGGAYTRSEWTYLFDQPEQSVTAFAGGVVVGLQRQWSNTVLGVEASYLWLDGEETSGALVLPDTSLSSDVSNLVLITGKLGHAWHNLLAFVKAGYASAEVDFRTTTTSTGAVLTTSSGREHGWTAGMGIDYAILPHISIGIEYNYVHLDVGGRTQTATPLGPVGTNITEADVDIQTVMARLIVKLGPTNLPVPPY
jgi:outer membrane immunogenic protein